MTFALREESRGCIMHVPVRLPRLQSPALLLSITLLSLRLLAVPPAPPDGMLDDGRILSDENRAALVQEMQALKESTGTVLMVETATFRETDLPPAAVLKELRETWLADQSGVVVSMTRSGADMPLVQISPDLWSRYGEPQVAAMMRRAVAGAGKATTLEEKLLSCVRSLLGDLREFEAQRAVKSEPWRREDLWLAGLFAGALLVLGLVIAWVVRRNRRLEKQRAEVFLLPDVMMSTRLGANGGGGTVVERSYRR